MKRLLTVLALCVPALLADNYPRQAGVDVQHYAFHVTLTDDTDEIAGETTVTVRFVSAGVTELRLDLASSANGKGMTVSEVTGGGRAAKYTHTADRLSIAVDPVSNAGEVRDFTVKYRGTPAQGLRFVKNKFGDRCAFSMNWPDLAHQWLPTIDHPYDKATSEFLVTAPAKYQVVSNGLLVEEIDLEGGRRLTHWKQSVPIAVWLNNIGVAQFASIHVGTGAGVPLQTWVFPKEREAGMATFDEPMRQAIEFFNDHVGPYPYEKLAAVENPAGGGGMEHASAIFYGQSSVNGKPAFSLVAHETAHQWFGDSVTEKDWDDVWLSEGFATYFALLATEHYQGRDAFVAGLRQSRTRIFATEKNMPGTAVVQNKEWKGIPNGIVYQKGGWALHVLRGELGTETFWSGIRAYYKRYRDSSASTADFRRVMEETSGKDLAWFFDQWMYRAGSPVVEGGWKYNAATRKVEVELAQTQAGDAYRLHLDVGVNVPGARDVRIEKIEMTGRQQKFEIACDAEPSAVDLDPNTWVLADFKFAKK
jgi:aminopeptidase N